MPIENKKYFPPVDNFCCLEDTNTLNYLFTKEPKLRQLYEKLKRKETALKINHNKVYIKPSPKEKTPYYGNVLADTETFLRPN